MHKSIQALLSMLLSSNKEFTLPHTEQLLANRLGEKNPKGSKFKKKKLTYNRNIKSLKQLKVLAD